MSAKFRVGDRVRAVGKVGVTDAKQPCLGTVSDLSGDKVMVKFDNWNGGWRYDGGQKDMWWADTQNLALAPPAAKFQVVYIEDGDETFDTQEAAEADAKQSVNDAGGRFAVVKIISIASVPDIQFERFA